MQLTYKDNLVFKNNQPICYNNQNYKIDRHIISIPLYNDGCQRFAFPVKQTERFNSLYAYIKDGCKLGKAKKVKAIKAINNKEQRWMLDLNHKISRQLINLAVQEQVGTIVMENLKNIRKTAKSLKRADRTLHSWTFYELQQFIEYKAKSVGIKVEYISPKYTSQGCSKCGIIKKSNRKANLYSCKCGNRIHADLNASRNITKIYFRTTTCSDGNSLGA